MNKFLKENSYGSQEGMHSGSVNQTQQGMQPTYAPSTNIPYNIGSNAPKKQLPYEIQNLSSDLGDVIVKIKTIRDSLEASLKNPSILKKDSKKIGITETMKQLDKINKMLFSISDYMHPFEVEN